MNQIIVRASSSLMATAAVMLAGVAIFFSNPETLLAATAIPIAVCPAEAPCNGTCTTPGDDCTPISRTLPDGTKRDACGCLP